MRDFLDQIRRALDSNLYYLSLFASLTVPDICGALGSSDGVATAVRYKAWFDDHLGKEYGGFFTGEDCYRFRCSMLHQGSTQHPQGRYSRVAFLEPSPQTARLVLHRNVMNDVYNIDIRLFCADMITSASRWLDQVEGTDTFVRNRERFIKRYPSGLPGVIQGVPVIS